MANELSAAIELAGGSVDDLIVTPAESLQIAVGRRATAMLGPLRRPASAVHEGATHAAYGAVRGAVRVATAVVRRSADLVAGEQENMFSRSRRGRAAISALNALAGDMLEARRSKLAIQMSVTTRRGPIDCDRKSLRIAFPNPGHRIALFIHGLGETPDAWRRSGRPTFGERLRSDFGMTDVHIQYNSGLRIGENGASLSALVESMVVNWPVRVDQLILIGHSMGGLVARSACHAGTQDGLSWPAKATHLFTLGSPHLGVPLEKIVHAAASTLQRFPESRPFADILDRRSAGIRDLRHGYLVEGEIGCVQTFISASVSRTLRHPLGWLAGDMLVRTESATGRRRDGSVVVSSDHVFHLGEMTHFDLLDHSLVYDTIRRIVGLGAADRAPKTDPT